jgi:hypothetical protein
MRQILLIAGPDSHGFGQHEYYAGLTLLGRLLNESGTGVQATVSDGWPAETVLVERADAIVFYCDGGPQSLPVVHAEELSRAMKRGAGLGLLHYALVVPSGDTGRMFREWVGGVYEEHWSVNPYWPGRFERIPAHPATRGVRPFVMRDEWYYHMRFAEDMAGVAPLLSAIPPESTREGPDGAHSGNPAVRARRGMPETVAWAFERPDGAGRGFGFTGGHDHWNWAHDDYRRLVLNAMMWLTGLEVPAGGVKSRTLTAEELMSDIRKPRPENWNRAVLDRILDEWNNDRRQKPAP